MPFSRVDYELLVEDLEPGQKVRVNHENCEAGEDTRRRLYIERPITDPTVVLYYCHNCSEGGVWHGYSEWSNYRDSSNKASRTVVSATAIEQPPNLIQTMREMPAYAVKYCIENKLNDDMLSDYDLGYDPNSDRFFLPQTDGYASDLEGYQLRLLRGKGPKYLTAQSPDFCGYSIYTSTSHKNEAVAIIVEDLISAIHIYEALYKDESITVAVNYGTKINTELLYALRHSKKLIVWLDNDNEYIRNQARAIARTATLFGTKSVVEDEHSDPKHYTHAQIVEVFNGHH